jgi:predicted alternative tryptophan synthase beta-subunit
VYADDRCVCVVCVPYCMRVCIAAVLCVCAVLCADSMRMSLLSALARTRPVQGSNIEQAIRVYAMLIYSGSRYTPPNTETDIGDRLLEAYHTNHHGKVRLPLVALQDAHSAYARHASSEHLKKTAAE